MSSGPLHATQTTGSPDQRWPEQLSTSKGSPSALFAARQGEWQADRRRDARATHRATSRGDSGGDDWQAPANLPKPRSVGQYSPRIYHSPSHTPDSSMSDESLHVHREHATPPESPRQAADSPLQIGRLSLEQADELERDLPRRRGRGRGQLAVNNPSSKRAASSELLRPPGRHSPTGIRQAAGVRHRKATTHASLKRVVPGAQRESRIGLVGHEHMSKPSSGIPHDVLASRHAALKEVARGMTYDSGYATHTSRSATLQSLHPKLGTVITDMPPTAARVVSHIDGPYVRKPDIRVSAKAKYPGLILQPESSPISEEHLAAEIKGIYAGLVMVETKCIDVDAAQAVDHSSKLGPDQWQALITLHRTLLYEHHDFLMATQHPSATPPLRNLATKYTMPARMWKHGIHAFLEVLRHRRPESQDYMLAFIYLAYQMMALLFETVPSFVDTWIECLGDLARYRMAIEENKEAHAQWGAVAARWYTMASDRHPAIGRLNHHLGILERPSLRKLSLYSKALTSVIPFPNARDSLRSLCSPIISDEQAIKNSSQSAEARLVTFHALMLSTPLKGTLVSIGADAVRLWTRLPSAKKRELGVPLAIVNISALLDLGGPSNILWQAFLNNAGRSVVSVRSSTATNPTTPSTTNVLDGMQNAPPLVGDATFTMKTSFCYACFGAIARRYDDYRSLQDTLPFVHVLLAWLHSLIVLRSRVPDSVLTRDACNTLLSPAAVPWPGLADLLNSLIRDGTNHISARLMELARQGIFPMPQRRQDATPLCEDFSVHGLVWGQRYFGPGWFDGVTDVDDGRAIETPQTHKTRVERLQWLGLYLAFHTEHLRYDAPSKLFSAAVAAPAQRFGGDATSGVSPPTEYTVAGPTSDAASLASRTMSVTPSAHSELGGDFTIVSPRKSGRNERSWASVAAKARQDYRKVEVVDEDSMHFEV